MKLITNIAVTCIIVAIAQVITTMNQKAIEDKISTIEKTQNDLIDKQNYLFELLTANDNAETTTIKAKRTNKTTIAHSDMDLFCLAKNVFHEAGVEDEIGMFAVAQVTLNRLQNEDYPKTICKVVMQPGQFSWTNNKSMKWSHPKGQNWDTAMQVAQKVINDGYRVPKLQTAMFYHASYAKPGWRDPTAFIAKVGTHIFYSAAR